MLAYEAIDKGALKTGWDTRHNEAFRNPKGVEIAIVSLLQGLEKYIQVHGERYRSEVADDGVLGDGVADIAKGIRTLLNGELGRLDAGTIDGRLCHILKACGELV